ncbi:MAG: hypothetical protein KTR25_06385 [Myxococcales bacterium]|nr:hypothetical protein [Myxococcales bacterium]
MKLIDTQLKVEDFFDELLASALETQRVQIAVSSRIYLVQLFEEFALAERFHEATHDDEPGPPTLAWLYERARNGSSATRLEAWRHLGDVALMVSSVFGSYLERRHCIVGVDYYVRMGTSAYNTAANYARTGGLGLVFEELSQKFRVLVDVLTRIGEAANLPVSSSIERLYERWLSGAGQRDLHQRLTQLGASPLLVGGAKA